MKIGVISDTHSHKVPQQVMDAFKRVDLIVHVGDFCSREDLDAFKKIQKVRAVFGNMDGIELRQILPEKDFFEVEGVKVGLYHGHGPADKVLSIVKAEFRKEQVDVVIFGHSHQPVNEVINHVLYFNPGSATDVVRAPYCSFGVIDIQQGKPVGTIVRIEGPNG